MYVFINIAIRKQKEDRGHSDPDLWRPFGELTKHVFHGWRRPEVVVGSRDFPLRVSAKVAAFRRLIPLQMFA
jgi:hypothetical protein